MFQAKTAQRERVNLMIGVDGPAGAGKTLSSLYIAYGITGDWKRIAVADTENDSALYYAGDMTGEWQHIPFDVGMKDGYSPANFCKLIDYAETLDIDVLVIDSISHEWNGAGGCLDIVNNIGGNSFTAWKTVTPMHNRFIDRMRHSSKHIVATMRSKSDYVLEENSRGKKEPKKVGLASVQRDGTDFEFGVIFSVGQNHMATVEKDRTNLFIDRPPFLITPETGEELKTWAGSGASPVYEGKSHQKAALMKAAKAINKDVQPDQLKALHEKMLAKKVTMDKLEATLKKEMNK
jgi:hypothetical protein